MYKSNSLNVCKKDSYIFEKILFNIAVIMVSFLASRTVLMGNFPLGVSLVSAASGGFSFFSAVLGASFGYFSAPNIAIGIRYISSIVAICSIRLVFKDSKKLYRSLDYIAFVTFLPIFVTGIAFKLAYGMNFYLFTECLLESLTSSVVSYILQIGFKSESLKNKYRYILPIFSFLIISFPISNLNLFSINVANIIMILTTLLFSNSFKIFGGSLSGIFQSLFYMVSSPNDSIKIISAPFCGMISGFFSKFGKFYLVISYIICNMIIKFQLKSSLSFSEIIEQTISSVIFLLLYKKINFNTVNLENNEVSNNMKSLVIQNVSLMQNSFINSKEIFEDISSKKYNSDSKLILKSYFDSASHMCKNIIDGINIDINPDISFKIKKIIKRIFNTEPKVSFITNKFKKSIIQIETNKFDIRNLVVLSEEISFICKKSFMAPEIFKNDNSIIIKFCEKTKFKPQIISRQHVCKGESKCGDSYSSFFDGIGNFYVIISDGMGKGNLASLSGNLVVKIVGNLLKSGIDIDNALFIANFVLMEKSQDESLATLDLLKINLFTGKSIFVKLGSASSFIKSRNNITKISSNCPPIGILPEIHLNKIFFSIEENDQILMVSDGVTDTGEKWVESIFSNELNDINIAEKVMTTAKYNRTNSRDDDITVIFIKITKC